MEDKAEGFAAARLKALRERISMILCRAVGFALSGIGITCLNIIFIRFPAPENPFHGPNIISLCRDTGMIIQTESCDSIPAKPLVASRPGRQVVRVTPTTFFIYYWRRFDCNIADQYVADQSG